MKTGHMSTKNDFRLNMFSNYAQEIEKHWKHKETQRRLFKFNSPQLELRCHLVDWVRNVSEKLKVSYRTIHLAVYILDMFMDNHNITKDRLGFVALVCLMLAAKFEEPDVKIPSISDLNKYDGCRYSNRDFISIEVMVLRFLDFGLAQPTIAHFAEYYALFLEEDFQSGKMSSVRSRDVAYGIVAQYLDLCLEEVAFLRQQPSNVAAACVLAARLKMKLSPPWTPLLAEITGYDINDLCYCYHLLKIKEQQHAILKKPVHSPDRGYISDC